MRSKYDMRDLIAAKEKLTKENQKLQAKLDELTKAIEQAVREGKVDCLKSLSEEGA